MNRETQEKKAGEAKMQELREAHVSPAKAED